MYLEKRKWNKIIFICSGDEFENIFRKFPNITVQMLRVEKYMNDRTTNFQHIFEFIIRSGYKVIVNNLSRKNASRLLFEASKYSITSQNNYQWVGLGNVEDFSFLADNDEEKSKKRQNFNDAIDIYSLIEKEFKGMIFISLSSPVNVRKNTIYQSLFNQYISTVCPDICKNIIDNFLLQFALAHDSILAYLYAF